tara:strand:- start:2085 stop:2564 length:480 start_codon:yes stop_codon:yes gene_type:complete
MTKALTGQIVAEHMDSSTNVQSATPRYIDETTNAATTVYSDGVLLRFAKTTTGVDGNFTIGTTAGSRTLMNAFTDYDGADASIYAGAAASGNESVLFRALTTSSYGATWTAGAGLTGAALLTANELNDDNLTDADFAWGLNAGDSTANSAATVDRTSWL